MVRVLALAILAVLVLNTMIEVHAADYIGEVRARAARGLTARVPCGQGKLYLDGPSAYVLWLKDDEMVYRYPEEYDLGRLHREDKQCASAGGVCDVTSLVIPTVGDGDAGTYRCRVHYQASPAVDFVVHLVIVDPPPHIQIETAEGRDVTNSQVGPLAPGTDLALACTVVDNDPETRVTWNKNGVVLANGKPWKSNKKRALLYLRNLSREQLNARYECTAQTADVTKPTSATIDLKMMYPPKSVNIQLKNPHLEDGVPMVVDCIVKDSEPPPVVSWTYNKRILNPKWHKEIVGDNVVLSSLMLTLTMAEGGHELRCRAHHPLLGEDREASVIIDVGFRSKCVKKEPQILGVVPGEMETATCEVEAHPPPDNFQWEMPNKTIIITIPKKVGGFKYRYSSKLRFKGSPGNLGVLACSGNNKIGHQREPCPIRVVEGRAPDPPICSPNLKTHTIKCTPGWDGGREQTLHLEVIDNEGMVIYETSDKHGQFDLEITPGKSNLTARIYASNSIGESPILIQELVNETFIFGVAPRRRYAAELSAMLLAFIASFILITTTCRVLFRICLRHRRRAVERYIWMLRAQHRREQYAWYATVLILRLNADEMRRRIRQRNGHYWR